MFIPSNIVCGICLLLVKVMLASMTFISPAFILLNLPTNFSYKASVSAVVNFLFFAVPVCIMVIIGLVISILFVYIVFVFKNDGISAPTNDNFPIWILKMVPGIPVVSFKYIIFCNESDCNTML